VFEGLLTGEDDKLLGELLFVFAHWHGLAKLRLHTDATNSIFHDVTRQLGEKLRNFKVSTCDKLQTKELPGEAAARQRRSLRSSSLRQLARNNVTANVVPLGGNLNQTLPIFGTHARATCSEDRELSNDVQVIARPTSNRLKKSLNLNTVKLHFLGDYPSMITRLGTTDSYTTQWVSSM
jgi:hypothetical protein